MGEPTQAVFSGVRGGVMPRKNIQLGNRSTKYVGEVALWVAIFENAKDEATTAKHHPVVVRQAFEWLENCGRKHLQVIDAFVSIPNESHYLRWLEETRKENAEILERSLERWKKQAKAGVKKLIAEASPKKHVWVKHGFNYWTGRTDHWVCAKCSMNKYKATITGYDVIQYVSKLGNQAFLNPEKTPVCGKEDQ
jgi:hypothetical protein